MELVQTFPRLRVRLCMAHWQPTCDHRKRRRDVKIKSRLDIRRILTRENRTSMDRLALGNYVDEVVNQIHAVLGARNQSRYLHIYGCFLLDVWAGVSHWSAVQSSVVLIEI